MRRFGALWSVVLLAFLGSAAPSQTQLLRFPDLHGDAVVFCHGGDLWRAPASGGLARRLTAHPGLELFPHFSPDGQWIAFTGQYDGDEQVYVIPAEGGTPKQLTFYPARGPLPPRWGYDNQVYGFTPDGTQVLFRSMRDGYSLTDTRLYTVSLDGGLPSALPMPVSGGGDLSPDGKKAVYSPLTRDFRTWKRYQGGWAQDLYVFDLASHEVEQVTAHPRTDRDPMWINNRICFASDRDGKLNLYAYDLGSKDTLQLTHERQFDVRWPNRANDERIIYELNGTLSILDVTTGGSTAIAITVPSDGLPSRPSRISVADEIAGFSLSPKGERALLTARGDVFTVPIEHGMTRNLTASSGAHDKEPSWSPDGKKIVYLSDATGEEELWMVDQDGKGTAEQLTKGGKVMRYDPTFSPNGTHIAFKDKDGKLHVLNLADKSVVEIADEHGGLLRHFAWSPNGGHIAVSLTDENGNGSLHIWSVADGKLRRITDETFSEESPTWDPEGNYLFYLSDREWAPQISQHEWNFATNRTTEVFALALRKDVKHPFPPRSDEVNAEAKADEKKGEAKPGDDKPEEGKKDEPKTPIVIDFDGLAERVIRVPIEADNLGGLIAVKGQLIYFRSGAFYYGRESEAQSEVRVFSMKDRKSELFASGIRGYSVSQDGSKILIRTRAGLELFDIAAGGKDGKKLPTNGLKVDRVPSEEWAQMFHEVWRRFRDFFYVPNMHGYDWEAIRKQYEPLLAHVAHRSDLNYVIGEMIGELNVSHAYIAGGDYEIPERTPVALSGARFALDGQSKRYKIARILQGQNAEERYRSPLTEVGVTIKVGDYVLAINGRPLTDTENPYRLLRDQASGPVTFLVNDKPELAGAREVSFRPLTSEASLFYNTWVKRNRDRVTELTQGRVGYLHIPDMGEDGIREFIKWFYPQIKKEGLIIDVRNNGGGNVSQMIIERLRRELLGTEFSRTNERVDTYPNQVFHGHLVCLLNENSASDGDIFPAMFKQAKLGPLIGKRSWGGIIGITDRGELIDGGSTNVPEFGNTGLDGNWIIEGYGVDPDIVVENDPKSVIEGKDPQLARGVEEVLKLMKANPKTFPKRPADPVRIK